MITDKAGVGVEGIKAPVLVLVVTSFDTACASACQFMGAYLGAFSKKCHNRLQIGCKFFPTIGLPGWAGHC